MLRLAAACLLLCAAAPAHAQDTGQETPSDPAPASIATYDMGGALRDYLRPLEARRDFSGVIAARRHGELVVYERFGAANFENETPITPETRFRTGSITKSLTAALILDLAEDGVLRLDEPVTRHLPDLAGGDFITIADILEHRAGLPRDYPRDGAPQDGDAVIAWLNAETAVRPGPHEAAYSNIGYDLLALIAERAALARFEILVSLRFFGPLGMSDSAVSREPERLGDRLARGYAAGPAPSGLRPPMDLPASLSASGLTATADDLLVWGEAIMSRRVDLFRPDGTLYGGLSTSQRDGRTIYSMQGTEPGYAAGVSIIPQDGLVIVFAANIESYPAIGLRDVLHAAALGEALGEAPQRPGESALLPAHREAAGRYQTPDFGEVEIREAADGMELLLLGPSWRFHLTPAGEDRFTWRLFNAELLFQRDPVTRLVTGLQVTQTPLTGQPVRYDAPRTDLPEPLAPPPAED